MHIPPIELVLTVYDRSIWLVQSGISPFPFLALTVDFSMRTDVSINASLLTY
jgi:hypothetical protein